MGAGAYRHLQARLRNNAESVAFYGGVEKEGRLIVHRFKELLRHHERLLRKQWQFGMVQVSFVLDPQPPLPPPTCAHSCCPWHARMTSLVSLDSPTSKWCGAKDFWVHSSLFAVHIAAFSLHAFAH